MSPLVVRFVILHEGVLSIFRFKGLVVGFVSSVGSDEKWLGVHFQKLCFFIVGRPMIRSIVDEGEILVLMKIIFVKLLSDRNSTPISIIAVDV